MEVLLACVMFSSSSVQVQFSRKSVESREEGMRDFLQCSGWLCVVRRQNFVWLQQLLLMAIPIVYFYSTCLRRQNSVSPSKEKGKKLTQHEQTIPREKKISCSAFNSAPREQRELSLTCSHAYALPIPPIGHRPALSFTCIHRLPVAHSRRSAFTHHGEVDAASRRQGKKGHGHQSKNRPKVEARGRFVGEENLHRSLQTGAFSLAIPLIFYRRDYRRLALSNSYHQHLRLTSSDPYSKLVRIK